MSLACTQCCIQSTQTTAIVFFSIIVILFVLPGGSIFSNASLRLLFTFPFVCISLAIDLPIPICDHEHTTCLPRWGKCGRFKLTSFQSGIGTVILHEFVQAWRRASYHQANFYWIKDCVSCNLAWWLPLVVVQQKNVLQGIPSIARRLRGCLAFVVCPW